MQMRRPLLKGFRGTQLSREKDGWLAENIDAAAETFYSFACVGRWS